MTRKTLNRRGQSILEYLLIVAAVVVASDARALSDTARHGERTGGQ